MILKYMRLLAMSAERKLLQYEDVYDDDRALTILVEDYTGDILVYYKNIILDKDDVENEDLYKKCSPEYFEDSYNRGRGDTIQEALEDYVDFLQGKTVCFLADDGEEYLVTFDFLDPENFEYD